MHTLETEVEIGTHGTVTLLSPVPAWLKPGRAHVVLMISPQDGPEAKKPKKRLTATPEMIARRMAALEELRRLNPYHDITDPVAWQRDARADVDLPGRA